MSITTSWHLPNDGLSNDWKVAAVGLGPVVRSTDNHLPHLAQPEQRVQSPLKRESSVMPSAHL